LGLEAVEVLRAHKENQWQQRKFKGNQWIDQGLMFPSAVGTPVQASNLRRSFRNLIALSGLPKIRFHDLRHTAASLMLNYGTPVIVVSERLGHSKASITLDVYGHLIPSQQIEAARLMDELMTPVALPITPKLHRNEKM
jgi:integrase